MRLTCLASLRGFHKDSTLGRILLMIAVLRGGSNMLPCFMDGLKILCSEQGMVQVRIVPSVQPRGPGSTNYSIWRCYIKPGLSVFSAMLLVWVGSTGSAQKS